MQKVGAVARLARPIERFLQLEASSGIVLIGAALLAFLWANSPWASAYFDMKHAETGLQLGAFGLYKSAEHWVNDGLMAIFFFLVGLEIKRELLVGELAGWRRASLPVFGALGGVIAPALIYVGLNWGDEINMRGWAVPMATDIAFAIGILSLAGDRITLPLKIFLLALAIVDDLVAVMVIALFYTETLSVGMLAASLAVFGVAFAYGRQKGRSPGVFLLLGLLCWFFMLKSGVHATIAGVLMAMAVPMVHSVGADELRNALRNQVGHHDFETMQVRIEHLENVLEDAKSPLHRFEHFLQPWVAFLVMPVFALFNAGVSVTGGEGALFTTVTLGCFLGLLIGKPVGVLGFVWIGRLLGLTELREGITKQGIIGVGFLSGIGFTMSLFVANLAFASNYAAMLDQAKLGVLGASVLAAIAGLTLLKRLPSAQERREAGAAA